MSPKRKRSNTHNASGNNDGKKFLSNKKRNSEPSSEPTRLSRRRTRSTRDGSPTTEKVRAMEVVQKVCEKKQNSKKAFKSLTKNKGKTKKQDFQSQSNINNRNCSSDDEENSELNTSQQLQNKEKSFEQCSLNRDLETKRLVTNENDNINNIISKNQDTAAIKKNENENNKESLSTDSSSESEWEEVAEGIEDKEPIIPKEGVEITLKASDLFSGKRKKKAFDLKDFLRMRINRFKKEVQINIHKVHLLCLLARGLFINNICNDDIFAGITLSCLPDELQLVNIRKANENTIKQILRWFKKEWKLENKSEEMNVFKDCLILGFEIKGFKNYEEYVCAFVILLRNLGFDVRLMIAFHPVSFKPKDLLKRKHKNTNEQSGTSGSIDKHLSNNSDEEHKNKNRKRKSKGQSSNVCSKKTSNHLKSEPDHGSNLRKPRQCVKKPLIEVDENDEEDEEKCLSELKEEKNTNLAGGEGKKTRSRKSIDKVNELSSDDDFEVQIISVRAPPQTTLKQNRKIKSEDEDQEEDRSFCGNNFWIEVYLESEKTWLCVDCVSNKVNCVQNMETQIGRALSYVVAFDNKNNVKDVTQRYAENWLSQTQKLRIDNDWWDEVLHPFRCSLTDRDKDEDSALKMNLHERPLPTTIGEFKNHQLYVLKRHLLKFEAIYPPDAPPVGFIRGEPVYARECVMTLHSRETWLKEARMVRIGEEPYKIVKARPKRNRWTGEIESNQPLEVYGIWQTEEYIPPVATNGKVPRNEYGNVELFKPSMLPIGTVILKVPGLNRVARKLDIDCAPAMIGWDYHSGGSHPLYDGWVVCEEFRDILMDAWREQQKITEEKEKEKREKRVYGNWRRLIKGLLIRERLKARYSNAEEN